MIRVASCVDELEAVADDRFSVEYEEALERLLIALFGIAPDIADDAWDDVAEAFDAEIGRDGVVEFCLQRGYDVRRLSGAESPLITCWRDIGIMVLARDRGLIGAKPAGRAAE